MGVVLIVILSGHLLYFLLKPPAPVVEEDWSMVVREDKEVKTAAIHRNVIG